MQKNLVIVESPAKAKTIGKFLGDDYEVLSSYGHIRDLKKKEFSIDIAHDFCPKYEIPAEKKEVVSKLKDEASKAGMVWLASDEDREGEAISWHLYEVLKLKPEKTKRIVFHEITKPAILNAIENPRKIDINLVNAQQARRVLDRIVGFELSPILWRKVKPALSAGRVQSVAVRLVVDKEREIQAFKSESSFRVVAVFLVPDEKGKLVELKAELTRRLKTKEEAIAFLEKCKNAQFTIGEIVTKPVKRSPAPPFTTSTLQQEAARKLGFTVNRTMLVAQNLYESGLITYMRTDSVELSKLAIAACKGVIESQLGSKYSRPRQFSTKTLGAQEAHEAIRPTNMGDSSITGTAQEKRLYDLIWKRTLASQMSDAELEKTVVTIEDNHNDKFTASGEIVKFDGFIHLYRESFDDDAAPEDESTLLPPLKVNQSLQDKEISATERFSQHPPRYTEASLVHKLEELGIGRPSTYAPIISTIQQRGYVTKENKEGEKRTATTLTLQNNEIKQEVGSEIVGAEKSKLLPTDIGLVVNDFLNQYFPDILDYHFTANVEKDFDDIAEGKSIWTNVLKDFYKNFHPAVESTLATKTEHKVGERQLGNDPVSGKPVSVKIGRFGPMIQIGTATDEEKPRFAQLPKGVSLETIKLSEALEMFKLPRDLGKFEGKDVSVNTGRFGPYVHFGSMYASLPKDKNPMTLTFEEAIEVIRLKREAEAKKHIKSFDEEPELSILNGRFGPYIAYKGSNYKIPKSFVPQDLELAQCMKIIEDQAEKKKTAPARKARVAKKSK
jgi:DNA topoisomerase-1